MHIILDSTSQIKTFRGPYVMQTCFRVSVRPKTGALRVINFPDSLDGSWVHWNHDYIPPWDKNDKKVYPVGEHNPDIEDIGANFYPEIGPYRSFFNCNFTLDWFLNSNL